MQDPKVRRKLKAETEGRSAKSFQELGNKYQCLQNTVKKYLKTMGVQKKKKKTAPATTETQEKIIKSILRLLSQNYFSATSGYKCVMYFTVEGNEWHEKYYFESSEHEAPKTSKNM